MKTLCLLLLSAALLGSSQSFALPNCSDPSFRTPSVESQINEVTYGKFCRAFVFKVTKSVPIDGYSYHHSIGTYNLPLKNGDLCSCEEWNQGFVVECNSRKHGTFSDRAYVKSLVRTPDRYCTTDQS